MSGIEPEPPAQGPEAQEEPGQASALPCGAPVLPRTGESTTLGRASRLVFARALVLGALVTVAYAAVLYMGPGSLDGEGAFMAASLGAVIGFLLVGIPSGIECWLATWPEVKRLRGFLLLYLGALVGWLASGIQLGYMHYVREGRELSEALVLSVESGLRASPPLLAFHVLLPVALALASLRRLRWILPQTKGPWRWVLLGLAICLLAGTQVARPWGWVFHVPLMVSALAVVLTLAYVVVHALLVSHRPEDAAGEGEFVACVEVAAHDPPTLWDRVLMGGDSNMVAGTVAWFGCGVLWGRLGGDLLLVVPCTLGGWFVHLILASNLPSMHLARGKPERALDLARFFLCSRTQGRLPAQARTVRLYREVEVRALLALGRLEEAARYLPEALSETTEGLADTLSRVRIATALVGAGLPELCREVVAPIPRDEQTAAGSELHAASLEAIALNALDRPQEAYDLSLPLLEHPLAQRKGARAVLLNNLAVYQARLGLELDLARERAEEASRLLPALAQTRSTLGAVLLAQGQPEAARPLLEAGLEGTLAPQARAWLRERLGHCYSALGEEALACESYRAAAEAAPETAPGRAAASALEGRGEPTPGVGSDPAQEATPNGPLPAGSP